MDVATHAIASLALTRAALPRTPFAAWATVVVAGTVADVDAFSATWGPAAYFRWHLTYAHSLVAALVVSILLTALYLLLAAKSPASRLPLTALFLVMCAAGWLHVAMDACQSGGVELLWPFRPTRIAADWLPGIDPWILVILVLAIALPELLRLVSSEIGVRDKRPRGRIGALVGLAAVLVYTGARASLHSSAIAALQTNAYRRELPRRVAAFPESASLLTWHGIAETDSALHEVVVNVGPGKSFEADGVTLFKPQPSRALDQAREADAAREFLRSARFPKATVEKTENGFAVQIRDLSSEASGGTAHEIAALVSLDANANVVDSGLIWARERRRR
jgi:membrane-bound metal-dependent hydrolase YbcI (DUF457 family)